MDPNSIGYQKLKESVIKDIAKHKDASCFNPEGCNADPRKCFHLYCDKFKWVVDRATHYAEQVGLTPEEILDAWEEQRSYWYMNYYQDCNQPVISKVRVFDTVKDMINSIADTGFRCPCCGGISKNPYECDSGLEMSGGRICDWKSYGLFSSLGKGVWVFVKEKLKVEQFFMPVAWEDESLKGGPTDGSHNS